MSSVPSRIFFSIAIYLNIYWYILYNNTDTPMKNLADPSSNMALALLLSIRCMKDFPFTINSDVSLCIFATFSKFLHWLFPSKTILYTISTSWIKIFLWNFFLCSRITFYADTYRHIFSAENIFHGEITRVSMISFCFEIPLQEWKFRNPSATILLCLRNLG